MTNTLGEKIRTLRKDRGLTLDGLAELAGASKSYIWELENKNPPRPSAEKVARIAEVFGVTSDYLMDATEGAPSPAVLEDAFFRDYRKLPDDTKEKLRKLVKVWSSDE